MVADFQAYKQAYKSLINPDIPPSDVEIEENILGCLLLFPASYLRVSDILEPQHFYVKAHQLLYKRIQELYRLKKTTDFMSLKSYLEDKKELEKIGDVDKLAQLVDRAFSDAQIDIHAGILVQKWVQRETIKIGNELIKFGHSYRLDDCQEWYDQDKKNSVLDEPGLFLDIVEKKIHRLTRSRYRKSLTRDHETVQADRIIDGIKNIENTISNPVHKRFKMMALAKEYKLTEKQLESLYLSSLIANENTAIEPLSKLREKYGNNVNEWFIQGMIPKGAVVLLHALGGVGKSRLAYDFCFSLATGTAWGGMFPVTAPKRKCLLVQTDESENDLLRSLNARGFTDDLGVFVKTRWTFDHIASLRQEIIDNEIDVIVIDSLTSVNKNAVVCENDTEYARPVLQLKDMAQELGCSIILIHHSNSEGKSRGTKAIHNSVSQVLSLKHPSEGSKTSSKERLLVIEKSRFRRPTQYDLSLTFDEETYQWSWICEGESKDVDDENDTIKDRIVDFLAKNRNKLFSAQEISEKLRLAYNSVRRTLFQLSELDQLIGRRRSNKKGKPWLHFLRWETEALRDHGDCLDHCDQDLDDQRETSQEAASELPDPSARLVKSSTEPQTPILEDQEIRERPQTPEPFSLRPLVVKDVTDTVPDNSMILIKYLGKDPLILRKVNGDRKYSPAKNLRFEGYTESGKVIITADNWTLKEFVQEKDIEILNQS